MRVILTFLFLSFLFLSVHGLSVDRVVDPVERADTVALRTQLQSFEGEVEPEMIVQKYNDVSLLWEQTADHLKNHFENIPQKSQGEDRHEMQAWKAEVAKRFALLKAVSQQRGRYLSELQKQDLSLFKVDDETFKRMGLEIMLIPYKSLAYFYEKLFWVQSQLQEGWWGFYQLFAEVFIFLLILILPFAFTRMARLADRRIEAQKQSSFYLSFRSVWHRRLANGLPIVSEYLPWLFTLVAIQLVAFLLRFSAFHDFSALLPYLYYFVYYKLFRITLELGFREFVAQLPFKSKTDVNRKIQTTSRFLGLVLLAIFSLEATFESILGQSLIFSIVEPFFGLLILGLLFYVSGRWEKEIESYLHGTNILALQRYAGFMEQRFAILLSLPGLFLILLHFTAVKLIDWSAQFDWVKLLYARVLRVKYESTRDDSTTMEKVDENYRQSFLKACEHDWKDYSFKKDFFRKIERQVELWGADKSFEQTVAIFGSKGCGKTIFLKQAQAHFEKLGFDSQWISVTPRVFTEKSFEQCFQEVFTGTPSDKKIVLLDNVHNMFLSTVGGFQVYRKFLEKTEEYRNIFWIASYNQYAWQFLNSVLGKNQYFRLELSLPRWSADEIKEMILDFHKELGYELHYDSIFRSSQRLNEEVTSAENRFFYLIWERSQGNPGLATYFWFRSLRQMGGKRLRVSLPYENPVSELSGLHQEMHFVYASLIKHENLNVSEASRATNLPRALVKQAIYRGVEEGFLSENEGRYNVDMEWLEDVKKYLRGKNLIYDING
jgi:hypothetical protein